MPPAGYRFGPFVVDRVRYRVVRDDRALELTPKLLDLLLHLLENAGALVTKEQLLDTLWPDANVTDNALAQAVSELRDALGDHAGKPLFIKTVARRGYRFIAPVEPLDANPGAARNERTEVDAVPGGPSIAVMDFVNVAGDPDSAWLSAGIAETVTGDLSSGGRFRVIDRGRVMEAIRQTNGSLQDVSARLGTTLAVVGSYQRNADLIRITSRILNVHTGEALADAKVDGPVGDIFQLQDRIVAQFSRDLGIGAAALSRRSGSRETASLEAYRAYTEASLHLETLDLRKIQDAIAGFERAIAIDSRYALPYTGLANAQIAAYESTRSDNVPAKERLTAAISHARQAVTLDESLAEAHATLSFVLISAWKTSEAVRIARRAVELEPTNWRHFFRLGHASWGNERLSAAASTLALYPDFAFAHFQIAMVYVARGDLREAEIVLRQGAALQDRQVARGDRYPALGLHWLLALVRLAQGDVEEALQEFSREQQLADANRLYGREYEMSALHGRGVCFMRLGLIAEALSCFERALELYPDHGQSHLGLAAALRASGSPERARQVSDRLPAILQTLARTRPIEAGLVESQILSEAGQPAAASAVLSKCLATAPPGFAAWTIPVEPFLLQLSGTKSFTGVLQTLAERAG